MIPWWTLLIAVPVSVVAGMWFTGGRWQRAWNARERGLKFARCSKCGLYRENGEAK